MQRHIFYPKIMRGARVVVYKWSKYSIQITNMKKHHTKKTNSTDSCLALTFNPTAHFFHAIALLHAMHCFVTLAYYSNTYRHLIEKKSVNRSRRLGISEWKMHIYYKANRIKMQQEKVEYQKSVSMDPLSLIKYDWLYFFRICLKKKKHDTQNNLQE